MNSFMTGFLVGALGALIVSALVVFWLRRRDRVSQQRTIDGLEAQIVELRNDRAEDKEANRRLRRDLAAYRSPPHVAAAPTVEPAETTGQDETAEPDEPAPEPSPEPIAADTRDQVDEERERQLASVQQELADVRLRLTEAESELVDREDKLTKYREALHEIRGALEAQDQQRES